MPENNGVQYSNPPQSRNEAIIAATIESESYTAPPQSRIEDLLLQLKTAIENGLSGDITVMANPAATGTEDSLLILQVGSTKYKVADFKTFKTMPSDATLLAMDNLTFFKTEGYYSENDGNGGLYFVTNQGYRAHGGKKLNTEGTIKYLVAINEGKGATNDYIDVCRYGVRPYGINAIDFSTITEENTYAKANSEIMANLYECGYVSYMNFPAGRFFFKDPLSLTSKNNGIRGASLPTGLLDASRTGYGQTFGGTALYFPFLTNGQTAVTISQANIENVVIVGNPLTYDITFDRSKTISAPEQVVTETIKTDGGGNQIKVTGLQKNGQGYIKNVSTVNFYKGANTAIANIFIENFYAKRCHTGLAIRNDNKCIGVRGFGVHTMLEINGSIISAEALRVDSCVNAVRIISGNATTLVDIDGDYCTDALIALGDGTNGRLVQQGAFLGIHGRCCTLNSFDSTQTDGVDVRELENTAGYGLIRVENGCTFQDSIIIANRIGNTDPFDQREGEPRNYRTPDILLTFGSSNTTIQRNQFQVNDAAMTDETEILKRTQTKTGASYKIDTHSRTFFIDGETVTKYLTNAEINTLIES